MTINEVRNLTEIKLNSEKLYAIMYGERMMKKIADYSHKHDWGITKRAFNSFIMKHYSARLINDYDTMAFIEGELEDINFHSEMAALHDGKYTEALAMWID